MPPVPPVPRENTGDQVVPELEPEPEPESEPPAHPLTTKTETGASAGSGAVRVAGTAAQLRRTKLAFGIPRGATHPLPDTRCTNHCIKG